MLDSLVPACRRFLRKHPDLPGWLLLFNALPVSAFVALVLVAAVINFGVAIIFQVATVVISLIWLIPCLVFGSTAAFICYFVYKKISTLYEKWRDHRLSPVQLTADLSSFDLPSPPSSGCPSPIRKAKLL